MEVKEIDGSEYYSYLAFHCFKFFIEATKEGVWATVFLPVGALNPKSVAVYDLKEPKELDNFKSLINEYLEGLLSR